MKALFKISLIAILSIYLSSCTHKARYFSEQDLVKIYTAHELSSPKDASVVIEQYHLADEKRREAYYNRINDLSTDESKFALFLKKVDTYKQMQIAQNQKKAKP